MLDVGGTPVVVPASRRYDLTNSFTLPCLWLMRTCVYIGLYGRRGSPAPTDQVVIT